MLHVARWKYRTQKLRKKSPSAHERTTLSRCIFATKACIDNREKLETAPHACPYNRSLQYGELPPTNGLFGGTPANFNGFRVLPSLLQQRRSPEANQTLHDVWPSRALVRYIFIFRGSCHLTEFCPVQNSLCVQLAFSYIGSVILHGTPAVGVSQTLRLGTRNGITELSQRTPPIYIRLGGHHVRHRPTF